MGQDIKETGSKWYCNRVHIIFIAVTFVLTTIVLGFTAALNILSFKQNYTDSLIRSYALAGKETVKKVEYAVKYGKPLDNFFGMQDLLSEIKDYLPGVDSAFIILPDGKIVYDLNGAVVDQKLDDEIMKKMDTDTADLSRNYISIPEKENHHVFISVHNSDRKLIGNLDIVFNDSTIKSRTDIFTSRLISYLIILSLVSIIVFAVLYKPFIIGDNGINVKRNALMKITLCILAIAQIIYGYINYSMFESGYIDITRENASMTSKIIQRDVESVISKGVSYSKLFNIEDYLKKITGSISEIENINIVDSNNKILYSTGDNSGDKPAAVSEEYLFSVPLKPDSKGTVTSVSVILSRSNINGKIRNILFDAVTIFAVSFFFMIEITLFVLMLLGKRYGEIRASEDEKASGENAIRPLAFIVYTVVFMSAAFAPVIMKTLYKPLFGLPKDIVLGLPISVEMLCGLIATVGAGYAIDKKGWKGTFVFGIGYFMTGSVLSGIVNSPVPFIMARGLSGAGFGLMVIAMRALVISDNRNSGIAGMNAGATAGVNCGVVTGAMMADRIGFANVFFISAAISILALIFAVKGIKNSGAKQNAKTEAKVSFKRFILDKQVFSFLILILIPFSICSMFLNYYFPIFADGIGVSSSNIGRAFMLNGLCVVYLGPFLSRYFERIIGSKKSLIAAVALTAFSILLFAASGSLISAFAAVLLMGVSDSFGIAAQIGFLFNSKAVKELGEGKSIAYYSLAGKLGQMLGPLIFGITAVLGIAKGVGMIGIGVLIALLLFMFILKDNKPLECSREMKL